MIKAERIAKEKIWEYIHINPILKENTGPKIWENAKNCALISIYYEIKTIEKLIKISNADNNLLIELKELNEIKKELEKL
jgi:hypothetical protein